MRIIINDTSCLIHLRKAGLLHATLLLPFSFQIVLPLVRAELLDCTQVELDDLIQRGLTPIDLPPASVGRALQLRGECPGLSLNDCLSLALAEHSEDVMLLSGDRRLSGKCDELALEVQGLLWICDRLEEGKAVTYEAIHKGLVTLRDDPVVFLPDAEVAIRIDRLYARLSRH